jgi:hypothetical protein
MNAAVEQVQFDAIHRFARSAEAFCAFMESQEPFADKAFVEGCAAALAALYHDVLALPDQWDETCQESDQISVDSAQVRTKIHAHLQRRDSYSGYFDPYDETSGRFPLLSDDLGDVYEDVRSGLESYRQNTQCTIQDAVFDWKFGFETHWGRHLVSALTALHAIIAGNLLADDEQRS